MSYGKNDFAVLSPSPPSPGKKSICGYNPLRVESVFFISQHHITFVISVNIFTVFKAEATQYIDEFIFLYLLILCVCVCACVSCTNE